jgi:hypothetical protein
MLTLSCAALFDVILSDQDASRATAVVDELLAHGFRGSLTGGLAVEAHLRVRGHQVRQRALNDVDFVVDSFASIPDSLADRFLLNHIHPFAPEGKTLIQLIDSARAVRIDVFRAVGATLLRSSPLGGSTGPLDVVGLEDLEARITAHVYGALHAGRRIEAKHLQTFFDLCGLGRELVLEQAWQDHCRDLPGSLREASSEARRLLALHPELVTSEPYSAVIRPCERCQDYGRFRCAPAERIVEILGYW